MTEKITKSLYWGNILIDFYPAEHWYKIGSEFIPSVTSICGVLDKPALIPRAIWLYKQFLLNAGEVITPAMVEQGAKEWRRVSQEATAIGTLVHDYCEAFATGRPCEMPTDPQAINGVQAFLSRFNDHNIKFLENERFIYSMEHGYCGKFDTIVEVNSKRYLVDFKTSKDFYPMEMGMQLAAYRFAYEEETGEKLDWQFILRFGKDTGDFETHRCKEYEQDLEAFLAALVLAKRKKETYRFSRDLI